MVCTYLCSARWPGAYPLWEVSTMGTKVVSPIRSITIRNTQPTAPSLRFIVVIFRHIPARFSYPGERGQRWVRNRANGHCPPSLNQLAKRCLLFAYGRSIGSNSTSNFECPNQKTSREFRFVRRPSTKALILWLGQTCIRSNALIQFPSFRWILLRHKFRSVIACLLTKWTRSSSVTSMNVREIRVSLLQVELPTTCLSSHAKIGSHQSIRKSIFWRYFICRNRLLT